MLRVREKEKWEWNKTLSQDLVNFYVSIIEIREYGGILENTNVFRLEEKFNSKETEYFLKNLNLNIFFGQYWPTCESFRSIIKKLLEYSSVVLLRKHIKISQLLIIFLELKKISIKQNLSQFLCINNRNKRIWWYFREYKCFRLEEKFNSKETEYFFFLIEFQKFFFA